MLLYAVWRWGLEVTKKVLAGTRGELAVYNLHLRYWLPVMTTQKMQGETLISVCTTDVRRNCESLVATQNRIKTPLWVPIKLLRRADLTVGVKFYLRDENSVWVCRFRYSSSSLRMISRLWDPRRIRNVVHCDAINAVKNTYLLCNHV